MSSVLETERLVLRELVPGDAPALLEAFADAEARRIYPAMADAGAAEAWIAANRQRYARDGFGLWALVERAGGALIGDCGLTLQTVGGRSELEVGWHVRADRRGRGLATEAGRACLAWGFRQTDRPRIVSIIRDDNAASEAVARKVHARRLPGSFLRAGALHHLWVTDRADAAPPSGR